MVFSGSVSYDAAAVRKMEKIRFRTFNFLSSAVRILCAGIMVVCGYLTGGSAGILFVAFGCILAVSRDITGRWRQEQTIKALQGRTILVNYEFYDTYFLSVTDGNAMRCEYRDLICLMEDDRDYYLFPNEYQVYMIEKQTLTPEDQDGFKHLLADQCEREWIRPLSLMTANLKQIIAFTKAVKRNKSIEHKRTE